MLQDFVACVAEARPPQADGQLGSDAIRVIYSAYVSAEEGGRVSVTGSAHAQSTKDGR
jgi:predicted dehydrogenase